MKAHHLTQACVLSLAAAVALSSCIVPEISDGHGSRPSGDHPRHYASLPPDRAGDAYFHGGQYYSGGRYETGTFHDHGRTYDNRYYHSGRYYYGGQYQDHAGHGRDHGQSRDYDRDGDYSDSTTYRASPYSRGPSITVRQ